MVASPATRRCHQIVTVLCSSQAIIGARRRIRSHGLVGCNEGSRVPLTEIPFRVLCRARFLLREPSVCVPVRRELELHEAVRLHMSRLQMGRVHRFEAENRLRSAPIAFARGDRWRGIRCLARAVWFGPREQGPADTVHNSSRHIYTKPMAS
jgi:hypothetical protein